MKRSIGFFGWLAVAIVLFILSRLARADDPGAFVKPVDLMVLAACVASAVFVVWGAAAAFNTYAPSLSRRKMRIPMLRDVVQPGFRNPWLFPVGAFIAFTIGLWSIHANDAARMREAQDLQQRVRKLSSEVTALQIKVDQLDIDEPESRTTLRRTARRRGDI